MAGIAGNASGVISGDDLGECFRLGAVCLMATRTDYCRIRKLRLHGYGIVGMPGLRTVTGFAGNVSVTPEFLLIDNVGVAPFADLVAREGGGAGGDLSDGVAAVVTELAKALGNHCRTQDNEKHQHQEHHDSETDQMFDVLEHGCLSGPDWPNGSGPLRHVI